MELRLENLVKFFFLLFQFYQQGSGCTRPNAYDWFISLLVYRVSNHIKVGVIISFLTSSDINIPDSHWFLAWTVNAFVIEISDKFRPRFSPQIFRTSVITNGFRHYYCTDIH